MPELPEVETLKRTLEPRILGARVERVRIYRRDVITRIEGADGSPRNRKRTAGRTRANVGVREELLEGDAIVALRRHGKQLAVIGASGRVMCFHLGMSGQVRVVQGKTAPSNRRRLEHVHVMWELRRIGNDVKLPLTPALSRRERENAVMLFRDPRRFGGIWTASDLETLERERWSELGPDALSITSRVLGQGLANTTRSIKAALLDQSVLAGVGNIYADEALFRAGIHPLRRSDRLTSDEVTRLAQALRSVLRASIRGGGTTLRDYVDANGLEGGFIPRLRVYGRGGEPCVQCGQILRDSRVAQRATVYCTGCQPRKVRVSVIHT